MWEGNKDPSAITGIRLAATSASVRHPHQHFDRVRNLRFPPPWNPKIIKQKNIHLNRLNTGSKAWSNIAIPNTINETPKIIKKKKTNPKDEQKKSHPNLQNV